VRVLIGCEYSARVRDAFRKRGHDAWSCDLEPCEGDERWHFQDDIFAVLKATQGSWDLAIFHPDCTYLTNAGVRWLHKAPSHPKPGHLYGDARWAAMESAARFFNRLKRCDIPRVALENPIPHGYARALIGDYDQTIQPHQFGQPFTKRTCLWLRNLNKLKPTKVLPPPYIAEVHHASPGPDRWKARSRTYQGIANAMAAQWG
jgi:hypothetical protein